jgi:hypothetical protein
MIINISMDKSQKSKSRLKTIESVGGDPQGDPRREYAGYEMCVENAGVSLDITPIETSKDKIEQPDLAAHEKMFIPPLGSSVIISGKSGSGKSTLLANFLKDPRFYGPSENKPNGWFDKIFLFSPTANGDDIQRSLNIPKNHVFTDLEEASKLLEVILDTQQKKLDGGKGADKVSQFCIIFDDVIGDVKFMNEKAFSRSFYQVRHVNCTTFICTQHFTRVPKVCRLQASFVFFFQGSAAEVQIVTEDFAPPLYSKNEFYSLVADATFDRYSFLTICMKVGWDLRFRKNLDQFIVLKRLSDRTCSKQEKRGVKRKQEEKKKEEGDRPEKDYVYDAKEYDEQYTTAVEHLGRNALRYDESAEQADQRRGGREGRPVGERAYVPNFFDAWG